METSQVILNQGLTFLAISTGVILLIIGGFLVKLLFDMSKLTKNLDETTTIIKEEVEPALKELNSTLHSINSIAQNADKKVDRLSKLFEGIFDTSTVVLTRAKTISGSFVKNLAKGLVTAIKIFMKK